MRVFKLMLIAGLILFLLLFNYHVLYTKGSANQTGLDVKSESVFFLVLAIVVFVLSKFRKSPTSKLTWIIVSLLLFTSANFFLFDYFNLLVEYNTWFGRGMPAKPFWF